MKTSILLSPVFAIAVFFGTLQPTEGRAGERDGYSVEVKVTPKEGEAKVTSASGIALERDSSVELPAWLSHSKQPTKVALYFDLSSGTVSVTIRDLDVATGSDIGILGERVYFEADLFFQLGKEKTICSSPEETISFTVRPPTAEGKEDAEGPKSANSSMGSSIDVSKLEAEFHYRDDRILGRIYNPTEQTITKMIVRITAAAAGEFKGIDQRYLDNISIKPLAEGSVQVEALLPELPDGVEYKIALESAR